MFAKIVLELPIHKEFDYRVPEDMSSRISPGMRVWVPFGPRRLPGYVLEIKDTSDWPSPKAILSFIDKESILSPDLIKLALWIGKYYCCSIGKVFKSMLPAPVRKIQDKKNVTQYVSLIGSRETIDEEINKLLKKAPKQAFVLQTLSKQEHPIKATELADISHTTHATINTLKKKGLVKVTDQHVDKDPYRHEQFQETMPHKLNDEQLSAYNTISEKCNENNHGVFLLHGITSSGKTEIYLQVIDSIMQKGKGAIVIVPEISLTPQTVERFKSRFRRDVAVLHSKLSSSERYDQWRKIYNGEAKIVVGARSAVFAPVKNLGLIVIDEEHEWTYKQDEDPKYHARNVAVKRAEMINAVVILGSATPSLESYHNALTGIYKDIYLRKRIDDRPLAKVSIIDMREEARRHKKMVSFSTSLISALDSRIKNRHQTILFINRRGFSPFIMCKKCGHTLRCPNCTTSLTYHQLGNLLLCHSCEHTELIPIKCPECQDTSLRFGGIGTQRVENQIAKFFPSAIIKRMDTDTTAIKGTYEKVLNEFKHNKIDILVGTQMIAKGLDFPNVTLVGVISADVALHLPDFRAGERTFQLLTQVAGRAGRGEHPGQVIIQTYTPKHPAILAAAQQDYESFAENELKSRKELDYPPYEHFVNVTLKSRNPKKAEFVSRRFQTILQDKLKENTKIFGPIPAPLSKLRGFYRWQIILKAPHTEDMVYDIEKALEKLGKPSGVIISTDVDPMDMM